MLVDDVAQGFSLPGFRMVIMDTQVTLKQVTDDIHKAIFKISKYHQVVILLGRQDVIQQRNYKKVLNKLVHALCTFGRNTSFILLGPLPAPWDSKFIVRDLMQAAVITKRRIRNLPGFKFCDASAWFVDRDGLKPQYMTDAGLTNEGRQLLKQRLAAYI